MESKDYLLSNGGNQTNDAVCDLDQKEKQIAKLRVIKNLAAISFGFLLQFIAYVSILNIQSSINPIGGLGTASLAVVYSVNVFSCLLFAPYMIERFGCKCTIVVSSLMYSIYVAANLDAQWYTLIPGAVMQGLGGGPLWSAGNTYITEIANQYAFLVEENPEPYITRFFGIYFMCFQSAQIWGNLVSASVLRPSHETTTIGNYTVILDMCGINFSNKQSVKGEANLANKNLERPSNNKIYTLFGIYLGIGLFASTFLFLFLGKLKRTVNAKDEEDSKSGGSKPSLKLMVESFRHLRNPQQLLIIPLTVYAGMELAFMVSDFTKAYVSCAWGIHNIGKVMICFGICSAISCLALGPLAKVIPRPAIFIFGALLNSALAITLFLWHPNPEQKGVFFVIAGLWGVLDAIWQTRINSLYGVLFEDNKGPAFANSRLWQCIGFIISFVCSSYVGVRVKLCLVLVFLAVGMTGYVIIEIQVKCQKRR